MSLSKISIGRGKDIRGSSVGATHNMPQRASNKDMEMLDAGASATSDGDKACYPPRTISQSTPTSAVAPGFSMPRDSNVPTQVLAITFQGQPNNKANPAGTSIGEGGEAHRDTLEVAARAPVPGKQQDLQLQEYRNRLAQAESELDEQKREHEDILDRSLEKLQNDWESYLEDKLHREDRRHCAEKVRLENDIKQRYEEKISRLENERQAVELLSKERLSGLEKEKRKVREHAMSIRTLQEHALKNVESAQWMSESDTEIVRQLDRILEDVKKWSKKWSRSSSTGESLDLGPNQCLDLLPKESLAIEGLLREHVSFERKIPMWLIVSAAVSKVAFDLIVGGEFFAFQDPDAKPATSIYSEDIGYALMNTLRYLHSRKSIDVLLPQSRPF
jgi:hypothetical protein